MLQQGSAHSSPGAGLAEPCPVTLGKGKALVSHMIRMELKGLDHLTRYTYHGYFGLKCEVISHF